MALRCLWSLGRASVGRNVIPSSGIHIGTFEMQPTKIPLTEEEKRLLEKLGEPDSETRGYLNELYVDFDVAAEKKREQRQEKKKTIKDENQSDSPPVKRPSSTTGAQNNHFRMLHTSAAFKTTDKKRLNPSLAQSRKAFENESRIIWDSEENDYDSQRQKVSPTEGVVIPHGKTGVFDVADFVSLLRQEKLQDIAVIQIPPTLPYADYMIVGRTLSRRQGVAITAFIKKAYKMTKCSKDPALKVEGENCDEWKVLDLGNIVLHLFDAPTREKYDIESLWTVGREFDEPTQGLSQENAILDVLGQHMAFVRNLSAVPDSKSESSVNT